MESQKQLNAQLKRMEELSAINQKYEDIQKLNGVSLAFVNDKDKIQFKLENTEIVNTVLKMVQSKLKSQRDRMTIEIRKGLSEVTGGGSKKSEKPKTPKTSKSTKSS